MDWPATRCNWWRAVVLEVGVVYVDEDGCG